MGLGDTTDATSDSIDLYSRVKLRSLNKKVHRVANDVFAAEEGKSANTKSRKSTSRNGQGVFSEDVTAYLETSSRRNAFAVDNSWLRTLTEVTGKEISSFYTWTSENKQMNHQFALVQDFDKSDLLLDEGTAIEMLNVLRRERTKNLRNRRHDIGDLVWGRVKSYPWWPGQIFDEALASPSVYSAKREGHILVAFYGDYTYAWLNPQQIIPFDMNYDENLKQTNVQMFLTAVEEAIAEIKRRVALGLVCHCQNHSNLQPTMMEGNSITQIQKARENFCPREIIYFLNQVALNPTKNIKQNPYWIKTFAYIFAYRRAVIKEFNRSYDQDFKAQHKGPECPAGIIKVSQKTSRAPFYGLLDAETQVKTKSFMQLSEAYDPQEKDDLNVSHGCLSRKHFEDPELLIRCEESKYLRQEGPHKLHIFSAKRRAVESEICSSGLAIRSARAQNLGDILKDSSEHGSSVVPSLKVEMIRGQVKNAPLKMFPVKTRPDDALRNLRYSPKPLQEQFRPYDLTNAGNKRSIPGPLEDFGMERPMKLNKMKSLARFAANQKLSELQVESQTARRSGSSIGPQKISHIKQKSIRRDVKERMLTIKFPPQSMLPSVSEVKDKFARFGPLDEYSTRVFWKSSAYQLVFLHKSDAEAAYHHAIHNMTLFSASEVRYYLQASDHDLNESSDSFRLVEKQEELQPFTSLSSNELAGEPMSVLFQSSLLPEKIQMKSSPKKLVAESFDYQRHHSTGAAPVTFT